ncbi:adenylate/guanylate cyclase domain-containing protein [Pseudodonghicola flavimaris]|uniref:Adenylate/guanylate cyclase domain-containing protein n=1 Tax=Pseudodonghicola flavimaris TaxID=3050036 RepID=A0ABT7EXW5_9RHOB|nr:adenylate/guanylate cyclase domain-containing protein [Pseudodonghicola flavimaris]MDK3017192.1 adenylate/guanylate cyclase domain-containing protein [Pseudodonghicola flavimaris]
MRFPLRLKFFVFAALLAVAPLVLVGQNLTRLTRDELKSAANEDLATVASELRAAFDTTFEGRWLTPLRVIRNGIDSADLGVQQKVSLLTLGLEQVPQVVALQLSVEGSDLPILVTNEGFAQHLSEAGLDPVAVLSTRPDLIRAIAATGQYGRPVVSRIPETDDWIATLAVPLTSKIAGRQVTMAAKIDLSILGDMVRRHPFAQRGEISIIDQAGRRVLSDAPALLTDRDIVATAQPLIMAGARAEALEPYVRPDGTAMLGAYAFPDWFPWAVITELSEESAYAVVNAITRRILIVGLVGFVIAGMGAVIFARQLTLPILKIGAVAEQVGEGDFSARVEGVRARDEIGDLARRFNRMIGELGERLELMKFVSRGTVSAIQSADEQGMHRGGTRRRVSVIFTDIRGYTEFSERVPPEVVIEALNSYFDVQTDIVERHGGDVDKFVGDALVAVFDGEEMELRATACALEITEAMERMLDKFPEYNLHVGIGVASGEVVMGATGARSRMDFTVLGSTVNLSSRLCSKAAPGQALIDQATREAAEGLLGVDFAPLEPVTLKGYAQPVPVYSLRRQAVAEA